MVPIIYFQAFAWWLYATGRIDIDTLLGILIGLAIIFIERTAAHQKSKHGK